MKINDLKWWISSWESLKAIGGGISDELEIQLKEMKKELQEKQMIDYCEPYLKIQRLIKEYHYATLKNNFEKATKIAHDLADETIKLEIASIKQLKNQWVNNDYRA